jgi:hypothetical protein
MNMKIFFFTILIFVSSVPYATGNINIPLTVHETLREGVSGVERRAEPVTLGLPFPRGVLKEIKGMPLLSLEGTDAYQFRTLKKWPDGSVQWALVDFQADVSKGKMNKRIRVTDGPGSTSGRLATDTDDFILVDTGIMRVKIRKKGFNLFDSVMLNDQEIISRSSKGIRLIAGKGGKYLAANDRNITVSIEENGPIRTVIKAQGAHIEGGKRKMSFVVRMHFYRNKSYTRVFYTLRNASKNQVEHAFIRSLDFVTKINLANKINIKVSKHDGLLAESISKDNQNLTFYQAVSDFPQDYRGVSFFWHAPIPPDPKTEKESWHERSFQQEGYWVKKNDDILKQGKRSEYPDLSFIDMSDSNGTGVTAGIRFSAGWWPKSLRAYSDGTLEVGLWPRENNVGYWIRYGSHSTFEVLYDFHVRENDAKASMKRFQYPLVAKAPPEWYNLNVQGIYPLYHFASYADEAKFVKEKGWEYNVGWRKPKMKVWRYHYWGQGGFLNQHDFARIALVNFLRETKDVKRAGESYLYADARFNYNADWAIYHSDDYDYERAQYNPKKNRDKAALAKVVFEIEHIHWYGLPLYYYLTGDERIKEAILDWSDFIMYWSNKHFTIVYNRFFGWEMYSLAALFEFTYDPLYMKRADHIFRRLLSAKKDVQNPWKNMFIDWNRGFVIRGEGELKPGLMMGYIIFDGLYNYYLQMDDNNPLKERVADVLEGLSDFMYREPYVRGVKESHKGKKWAFWLPYRYNIDDKSKSRHSYRLIQEAFYVNLAPYLSNGDPKWLERMDNIIRSTTSDLAGMWEQFGYVDHPGLQSILYQRINPRKDDVPPQAIADLKAEVLKNEVLLSWTVPQDADRFQIKYSKKKLVESLGFNPDSRNYLYNPKEYKNWWAGKNLRGEPVPVESGSRQQHVVKGLKPGHYYFAIRSWDASNNRSPISNLAEVVIK